MFFNFFKRSKTRNSNNNKNEKQTLPDTTDTSTDDVARKPEKIPKGEKNAVNEKHSQPLQPSSSLSHVEKINHCAHSLVSALHLNPLVSHNDNDTCENIGENNHRAQAQYYYNNLRKQNNLVGEVNVYNNNNNKGDQHRQTSDNNSEDSNERTSDDDARLRISKFSPKLFTLRGVKEERDKNTSGTSSFFNDLIMGKGRQRHRGARPAQLPKPQVQGGGQKNATKKQQTHGSRVNNNNNNNDVGKNKNLPQNSTTTMPEKCENQGDKKNNVETLNNRDTQHHSSERGVVVVKNNTQSNNVSENLKRDSPDVSHDDTRNENFPQETETNASSFIHALPLNEQGGSNVSNVLRDNDFAPPEKKTKICEKSEMNYRDSEHENHQKICTNSNNCEIDEMGQPNSKNGVNNNINESNANFNSSTSVSNVSPIEAEEEENTEKTNQDTVVMGTDETIGGGHAQRAVSPCGSNITKTVRFNDENLCSYADDIFYEANTSIENLPNYFNNSNCDQDENNTKKFIKSDISEKVPLVKCDVDDFDKNSENNNDDDDETPSTYEEAQSISVFVKDVEYFENIVQQPLVENNGVQTQINNQENNHETENLSAFNEDESHTDITSKENTSIYNNDHPPLNEEINQNFQIQDEKSNSMTDTNCAEIHSFNNYYDDQNDKNSEILINNNKNLYMEETISLPDIVESSHQIRDESKLEEKPDKMGNEM